MGDFTPTTEEISCIIKFKAAENANRNRKSNKDIGLTDGEGMERLWSYLSGFVNMTRHMDSRRRMKTLVHAIQHYRLKVIFGLGKKHADLKHRCEF